MAREVLKKEKICVVCGTKFNATGKALTDTPSCRTILSNIKKEGNRPSFYLIAKHNGQELPEWMLKGKTAATDNKAENPETSKDEPKKEPSPSMSKVETLRWLREINR